MPHPQMTHPQMTPPMNTMSSMKTSMNEEKKNQAIERAQRLKHLRISYGLSVIELAKRASISKQTIYSWQYHTNCLTPQGAHKIALALHPETPHPLVHWLLTGQDKPDFTHRDLPPLPASSVPSKSLESDRISFESPRFAYGSTLFNNDNSHFLSTRQNPALLINVEEDLSLPLALGDAIGGIKLFGADLLDLKGHFCLFELRAGGCILRYLDPSSPPTTLYLKKSPLSEEIPLEIPLVQVHWGAKVAYVRINDALRHPFSP